MNKIKINHVLLISVLAVYIFHDIDLTQITDATPSVDTIFIDKTKSLKADPLKDIEQ